MSGVCSLSLNHTIFQGLTEIKTVLINTQDFHPKKRTTVLLKKYWEAAKTFLEAGSGKWAIFISHHNQRATSCCILCTRCHSVLSSYWLFMGQLSSTTKQLLQLLMTVVLKSFFPICQISLSKLTFLSHAEMKYPLDLERSTSCTATQKSYPWNPNCLAATAYNCISNEMITL